MLLVQPLDDRQRLRETGSVVELERGQQGLRVHLGVLCFPLLALRQMHEDRLVADSFQTKRDAHAECRRAAKVRV